MGQYRGLWELLKGMESPWCDGITWVAWKASDRRSLDLESRIDLESWIDLESLLEGCGRFSDCNKQRVGLITVNVCNKQQIELGMTLSAAEVGLLLRTQFE